MNTKYYVINLDISEDRLRDISSQFTQQNIEFERVVAVDGRVLDLVVVADDIACRNEMGRSIQPGEVGCFLSHRRALESFTLSNAEFAVILEDDAVLTNQFSKCVEDLCDFLEMNRHLDVFAINLGAFDYKYTTQLIKDGETELLRAHRFPMLATGILWTRKGAKAILNDNGKVKYPYDNYLRLRLTRDHVGLSVRPPLICSSYVMSDIDARSITAGRSHQNRSLLYFFKKQKRMLRDKIIAVISMINWRFKQPKLK